MKFYFFIISIIVMNLAFCQQAQVDSIFKEINSEQLAKSIFVIGEDHFKDNLNHKEIFISKIENLCYIGLEIPVIYENYCKNYILNGDERIFDFISHFKSYKNELEVLLRMVRSKNLTMPDEERIKIFCFDIPFLDFNSTNVLLLDIFKNIQPSEKINVVKILKKINQKPFEIIQGLNNDLASNDSVYKNTLLEFYPIYLQILQGLQISFPKQEGPIQKIFLEREPYMFNIIDKKTELGKILIFCGNMHASKKRNDTNFFSINGNGYTSFTCLLNEKYPTKIFSTLVQYSNLKLKSFFEWNPLGLKNKEIFDYRSFEYRYIFDNELKTFENIYESCDLILIKNMRYKK